MDAHPRVRIAAFNVLAQCLAKSDYFPRAGSALKWKSRWPALQRDVMSWRADVMSLSEVDRVDEWISFLESHGYATAFKRRGRKAYGQLIAWCFERFELVASAGADMNDIADTLSDGTLSEAVIHRLGTPRAAQRDTASEPTPPTTTATTDASRTAADTYRTDTVAMFVSLRLRDAPGHGIVVGSTHFYWAPDAGRVRAAQAATLQLLTADTLAAAAAAGAMSHQGPGDCTTRWHVVLGGDYNSRPAHDAYRVLCGNPLPTGCALPTGQAPPPQLDWDTGVQRGSASAPASVRSASDVEGGGGIDATQASDASPGQAASSDATPAAEGLQQSGGDSSTATAQADTTVSNSVNRAAWRRRLAAHMTRTADALCCTSTEDRSGASPASKRDGARVLRSAYALYRRGEGTRRIAGAGVACSVDAAAARSAGDGTAGGAVADAIMPTTATTMASLCDAGQGQCRCCACGDAAWEPEFTTHTGEAGFIDTIDYIFVSDATLTVTDAMPLPSASAVGAAGAPSAAFPSDHFPLVVELALH